MEEKRRAAGSGWGARCRRLARYARLGGATVSQLVLALAQFGLLILFILMFWRNGSAVEQWVLSITKLEFAGISINRESARANISELFTNRPGAQEIAQAAVTRAIRSAPAIVGSRVLWVDSRPHERVQERRILEDLGIRVQMAVSMQEALRMVSLERYDVVVSRLRYAADDEASDSSRVALDRCPAHQFEVVGEVDESERATTLASQNATLATHPPRGFELAERMALQAPRLVNRGQSFLIFYSTFTAEGTYANRCARLLTGRAEIMLNGVVSLLEEANWRKLVPARETAP